MRNNNYNWAEFDPHKYLAVNYAKILPPDKEILIDLVKFYASADPKGKFLEVGCGPNLYPVFAMLPFADSVDIIEYGIKNLFYLKEQKNNLDNIWGQWIDFLRKLSPVYSVDFAKQFNGKVNILQGSVFSLPQQVYNVGSMHFVSESITTDLAEFNLANRKFLSSLKPGGLFVSSFMENSEGYTSPGKQFPAVAITGKDIKKSFKSYTKNLNIKKITANQGLVRKGHSGMLFVSGKVKP